MTDLVCSTNGDIIASIEIVGPATGGVTHLALIIFQVRHDVASPAQERLISYI
jgi:hypothetical protein